MATRTQQTPVTAAEHALMVAETMSEGTFQTQVEAIATRLQWRCYHTKFSAGSSAGFPDLVLVRGTRLVFAELKRQADRYKPTAKQQAWLDELGAVGSAISTAILTRMSEDELLAPGRDPGVEVYLWRPLDITSTPNRVLEVLR